MPLVAMSSLLTTDTRSPATSAPTSRKADDDGQREDAAAELVELDRARRARARPRRGERSAATATTKTIMLLRPARQERHDDAGQRQEAERARVDDPHCTNRRSDTPAARSTRSGVRFLRRDVKPDSTTAASSPR